MSGALRATAAAAAASARPFPLDVLPGPLRRFVEDAAASFPCEPDFAAVPMITLLASAIGNSRALRVKSGWVERPIIFAAIVGDPGSKKSPALAAALAPLAHHQAELRLEHQELLRAHAEGMEHHEAAFESWRRGLRSGDNEAPAHAAMPDAPERPSMRQIFTTDATVEALADMLARNPRGVVCVSDELAGWVRAMNQYRNGRGSDRQHWLSLWSGSPIVINRKASPEPLVVPRPHVCVVGGLPPDVVRELVDSRDHDDGFMHRIAFSFPVTRPSRWTDETLSDEVQAGYEAVYRSLVDLIPERQVPGEGVVPKILGFTTDARRAYADWVNAHAAEMATLDPWLRGAWAKLEGYCARFALVLQELRYVCGEDGDEHVSEQSVKAAIELAEYHGEHVRRIHSCVDVGGGEKRIMLARAWIGRHGGTVSLREVQRAKVAGVTTAADAEELLAELAARGLGTLSDGPRGAFSFELVDTRQDAAAQAPEPEAGR